MTSTAIEISEYQRKHREDIISLLFYSQRTHTHLDWYKASQWLTMPDNLIEVAYEGNTLVGFWGLSAPLNHSSWVRIGAIAQQYSSAKILAMLWEALLPRLSPAKIETVSILAVNSWLNHYLGRLGFEYLEDVVTLARNGTYNQDSDTSSDITIRRAYLDDIGGILRVDHAAFAPPWQLTATDVRYAQRQASSCTVAEYGDEIIAYELSTRYHTSGHLARLGVHPKMQGKHVGAILLDDLLTRFTERGVQTMTVNTQDSNSISQHLYQRFGFYRNGFDFPIWQYQVV